MADQIRELTPELLAQRAHDCADQHIPLSECNSFEAGTALWHDFNSAYRAREVVIHAARRDEERREVATC
jgi:hypothetical protein